MDECIILNNAKTARHSNRYTYIPVLPLPTTQSTTWAATEVSTMGAARYRTNCLPRPQEPFKQDTVDLAPGAIEGAGDVFSQ